MPMRRATLNSLRVVGPCWRVKKLWADHRVAPQKNTELKVLSRIYDVYVRLDEKSWKIQSTLADLKHHSSFQSRSSWYQSHMITISQYYHNIHKDGDILYYIVITKFQPYDPQRCQNVRGKKRDFCLQDPVVYSFYHNDLLLIVIDDLFKNVEIGGATELGYQFTKPECDD